MNEHINIENYEITIPYYAVHKDGLIAGFFGSYRFLSNFYMLETGVWYDELIFPSVENAYQAAKWPIDQRTQFLGITAGKAKRLGKLAPKLPVKWEKFKTPLMISLVRQKFLNNEKLKKMLLATDGYKLEERNSWGDKYWGTDVNGVGESILGNILMDIRQELKTKKEIF